MTTEAKEGLNPQLDSLRALSLVDFHRCYSADEPELEEFGMFDVFPVSTEPISSNEFDEVTVRGGIHLSVAGGLDTPLAQVAVAQPDLSILCDVNTFAVPMIISRLKLLGETTDGQQYWQQFQEILEKGLVIGVSSSATDIDYRLGGWSSPQQYPLVKKAWNNGVIKFIHSDIVTDGLETGMQVARETGVPIRLINLSNIFDHRENRDRLGMFKSSLRRGIADGTIDPKSQIVATSLNNDLKHQFWETKFFADPRKALI